MVQYIQSVILDSFYASNLVSLQKIKPKPITKDILILDNAKNKRKSTNKRHMKYSRKASPDRKQRKTVT